MKIYIGIQKGVYRHEIVAVHRILGEAIQQAKEWMLTEQDKYHDVEILELSLPFKKEKPIGQVLWRKYFSYPRVDEFDTPTFLPNPKENP